MVVNGSVSNGVNAPQQNDWGFYGGQGGPGGPGGPVWTGRLVDRADPVAGIGGAWWSGRPRRPGRSRWRTLRRRRGGGGPGGRRRTARWRGGNGRTSFGNARRNRRRQFNGNLAVILDNSALDAKPFSLTGQETPKAAYNHFRTTGAFGGPLKIPKLLSGDKTFFFINYQLTRNRNASIATGLVPTADERAGMFPDVSDSTSSPQASGAVEFLSAAEFFRRLALQLPDSRWWASGTRAMSMPASARPSIPRINQRRLLLAGRRHHQPEPVRFRGCHHHDRHQQQCAVDPSFHDLSDQQPALQLQPFGRTDHAFLRQHAKRLGQRGHLGQRSGSPLLGTAQPVIFERDFRPLGREFFAESQRHQPGGREPDLGARQSQFHFRRRFPPARFQPVVPAESARHLSYSPARSLATISPISWRACRPPAPSPTETPTNISAPPGWIRS